MVNEKHQSLKTMAVLILAALVFSEVFKEKGQTQLILLYVAMVLAFLSAFWPWASLWIHRLWMKLGEAIGAVVSRIILSVIFYLLLTPLAWLNRLFSKNPRFIKGKVRSTYYTVRQKQYERNDLGTTW